MLRLGPNLDNSFGKVTTCRHFGGTKKFFRDSSPSEMPDLGHSLGTKRPDGWIDRDPGRSLSNTALKPWSNLTKVAHATGPRLRLP